MVGRRSSGGEGGALTFVISVAAELAGLHPQTLRQYDRLGLVVPARTAGRGRRYTQRDVQVLREIQRLSQEEGINLAGIQRIRELERRVERLVAERDLLRAQLDEVEARRDRVFAASPDGEVRAMRRGERPWPGADSIAASRAEEARDRAAALTLWRPHQVAVPGVRRVRAVIEAGPQIPGASGGASTTVNAEIRIVEGVATAR
ncbi:helix-turn-helix transcriptional regulator [Schaalia sp. 19OD2882]|uniref:heat shock protein transcriptional repressor HspR n=1 Tax=Schaalia sp. 19OD2882 TaxID=2794089 RepID=UPI001C1EAF9B|nr:helix-turn-helix transcriptional regulator [Schaalia sp. 19OD2882]QWW19338.1 helix-turn-helix transcriptional regulator [Schaalia sp. 19OD2882]